MSEIKETYETTVGLTAKVVEALSEPFPAEALEVKTLKGQDIRYVSWPWYVRRLNEVTPNWSMSEPVLKEVGGKLVVGISLTINGVTRWNYGDEELERDSYGTPVVNGFAQAFKRTAAMFGVGLYLYDSDAAKRAQKSAPRPPAAKPMAKADTKSKPTEINTDRWPDAVAWLTENCPHYKHENHILNALAQGGYVTITDANLKEALAFLRGRVDKEQGA